MEKNDYGFYDSINNTATRWLAWNLDQKGKIGFECLSPFDEHSLWLLCMARNLYTYSETPIYVKSSFFDYIWLKFIKRFKFIKRYRKRKHQDVFLIDTIDFIEELCKACHTVPDMIIRIYEVYYKR